jgi:hypothetical protein
MYLTNRSIITSAIVAVLICSTCTEGPGDSRAEATDPILQPAIEYIFRLWDPDKNHKPWECWTEDRTSNELAVSLRRFGATLNPPPSPSKSPWPKRFLYLDLEKIKWINKSRVSIKTSIDVDFASPIITEAYGEIYLDRVRTKWIVDTNNSYTHSGD